MIKILLVEDEVLIAIHTKQQLINYGYEVETVVTGEDAVEYIQREDSADLVLMDINLGAGIDGTEAARQILNHKDIPLIFHSSHTEPQIVEKTEEITNYGYVVKNSGITVLDASIKMALRLHDAYRDLEEKTNILEDVINYIPGFVLWKDRDLKVRGCNRNFAEKYCYSEVNEIVGKTDYELHSDKSKVQKYVQDEQSILSSGEPKLHLSETNDLADGKVIHLDTSKIPMKDKSGNIYGILVLALDVTANILSESTLIETESRLNTIFNNIQDGLFIHPVLPDGSPGKFAMVNDSACSMLGYSRQELTGMEPHDIDDPDEGRKNIPAAMQKLAEEGSAVFETIQVKKNGERQYVEVTSNVINYKGEPHIISSVRDITSRKHTEKQLIESEERFKALHNASFGGIAIHDKGYILDCNQGLAEISGFSYDELIGMNGLLLISPEKRDYVMQKITSGFEDAYEAEGIRKDGSIYPLRLHAKNIPYKGKQVRVVEFRDITELITARQKLEALLNAKQTLLHELNHRIKNSFLMIQSILELKKSSTSDPALISIIDDIGNNVSTISEIYSMLNETGAESRISLDSYLGRIVDNLQKVYESQMSHIVFSVKMDRMEMSVKRASIIGMIVNELLTNSMKYAFPDGRKGEVELKLIKKNDLIIEISDNGAGLPEDISLNSSTGFGLQLVSGMVEQLEGRISIKSSGGTAVRIELPCRTC